MSEIAIGTIILFASLVILMALRFPIAYGLGVSAIIAATYCGIPYLNLFQKMTTGLSSFTFIAVPFRTFFHRFFNDWKGSINGLFTSFINISARCFYFFKEFFHS